MYRIAVSFPTHHNGVSVEDVDSQVQAWQAKPWWRRSLVRPGSKTKLTTVRHERVNTVYPDIESALDAARILAQQLVGTVPDGVGVAVLAEGSDAELGGFWIAGGDPF